MPNKYIRHGATYCGDGTTSDLAASNGAAGAWNNINVFTGTAPAYGTLAAGDTVYIRSKDASDADITVTVSANTTVGSASATVDAWVTWILDDGTTWTGINGTLTLTQSAAVTFTIVTYNRIVSKSQGALHFTGFTGTVGGTTLITLNRVILENLRVTLPLVSSNVGYVGFGSGSVEATLINLQLDVIKSHGCFANTTGHVTLINPIITLGAVMVNAIFSAYGTFARTVVYGGVIKGPGATTGLTLANLSSISTTQLAFYGTKIPSSVKLNTVNTHVHPVNLFCPDGGSGSIMHDRWGILSSRADGFYPTLNATLPDSNSTAWAWMMYPLSTSFAVPAMLSSAKLYTSASAAKTINVECLIADTITNKSTATTWCEVIYTDATTNEPTMISSRTLTDGALTASDAGWRTLTWGDKAFLNGRYRFSLTTPTAIKQDTQIFVRFCTTILSASDLDILFIDPDFWLS